MNIETTLVFALQIQGIAIIVIGLLFCSYYVLILIQEGRDVFAGRTQRLVRSADRLLHHRKLDAAISKYSRAIVKQPDNIRALLGRSSAYIRAGELEKGVADCNTIIELNPQTYDAFLNRGSIHQLNEAYDDAVADFSRCIELQPSRAGAFFNRGYVYAEMQLFDKGLADLSKAIELDPPRSEPYYYFLRGYLHLHNEAFKEAVADVTEALDCGYRGSEVYGIRAYALNRLGQFKQGIADYEAAIRDNPENAEALNGLAWILAACPNAELRNGARAVEAATESCRLLNHRQWYCVGTLAAAYAEVGDFEKAIELAKKSLEMAPDDEKQDCEEQLKLYKTNQAYRIPDSTLD